VTVSQHIRSGTDGACGVDLSLDVNTGDILSDEGARFQIATE